MKNNVKTFLILLFSVLTLTNCGGGGGSSSGNNSAVPTADAGSDRIVQIKQSITISGSGSDTGGRITAYQWKEGATVLADTASFTYTAPATTGTHTLTLTVTNNVGATASDSMIVTVTRAHTIHITEDYQVERLGTGSAMSVTVSIDTADTKDLYLLLSNYDTSDSASVSISHSNKVATPKTEKILKEQKSHFVNAQISHLLQQIQNFNDHLIKPSLLTKNSKAILATNNASEGDTHTFYLDATSSGDTTQATLKKVVSDIPTEFGNKTLNIWVSDNSFGAGCGKSKCMTQEMVDALADMFLKSGSDNDIYDWVTNIFGEEWGADAQKIYSNLIGETDQIDILLTDIGEDDSPDDGILGYFYAKDNYDTSSISGSNERIMFYADSVIFANGDDTWNIDDFWPKEMISTLAHEFQHMIHFYQKSIPAGGGTDTWINEMLSEATEDVIATKIKHIGPRGVAYTDGSGGPAGNTRGRYPIFNEYNTYSLTKWNGNLADYAKVNAFGTYLTRNYGVQVLHDIVHNTQLHEDAIVNAVHNTANGADKTFDDLLREWGIGVMLSDHTDLQDLPVYNTGDFTEDRYNNSTYQLGSINFFNYDPKPTLHTSNGTVAPQGNYYYKVGEGLRGNITIDLSLNGTTEATLIAK